MPIAAYNQSFANTSIAIERSADGHEEPRNLLDVDRQAHRTSACFHKVLSMQPLACWEKELPVLAQRNSLRRGRQTHGAP